MMPVLIETFVLGPLETNTYLIRCDGQAWVVDPAMGLTRLLRAIEAVNVTPSGILLTHGHGDHIAGVGELKEAFPDIALYCPVGDEIMLTDPVANLSQSFGLSISAGGADELVRPGQQIILGDSQWLVLDTRGHTQGAVSYYCRAEQVVLTGDSLFAGSIGRTDIPNGSASRLLRSIRENLLTLPDQTRVLPGHGGETTISAEKLSNPFLV